MARLETVKIVAKDGFAIINKSDFDPKIHKMAGAKAPTAAKPVAAKKKSD